MVDLFRQKLTSLSGAAPDRRPRRARLGFYGYRYRSARSRTSMVAKCTIAAILLLAIIAAASAQFSR
jgi:hypothetical protein